MSGQAVEAAAALERGRLLFARECSFSAGAADAAALPPAGLLDQAAVTYQIVLTKIDKVTPAELDRLSASLAAELAGRGAAHPEIIATSSLSGAGIAELRAALAALASPTQAA